MTLAFRLGGRMIAACGIADETFSFYDSRYLGRRSDYPGAIPQYFSRLLEQANPTAVYVYAPTPAQSSSATDALLTMLETAASAIGLSVKRLERSAIFTGFGLQPLRSRAELLESVRHLWPELRTVQDARQMTLAEAAAAVLVGDLREGWPPV